MENPLAGYVPQIKSTEILLHLSLVDNQMCRSYSH